MSCNRKNVVLITSLLFLLPLLGSAQWLETTIHVPDSLCGMQGPYAFTYNSNNNTVYVVGQTGDCVIAIDGATDEKIAKIPIGSYSYQTLVYNPINNKIYYTDYLSDTVTVIDGAGDSVITKIAAGSEPFDLAYNPTNNKVYCANRSSDSVTVISGASNSVLTPIAVGDEPCALVYNPTENKICCGNRSSDNVTVIDGASNSVITTIGVGDEPRAFAWNPAQNRIYVANYGSSSISVIRDATGIKEGKTKHISRIYPGPTVFTGPLSLLPDKTYRIFDITGREIHTLNPAPGIYFIEVDGKISQKTIKVK